MASFQMRHRALKQSKHLWALWELVRQYLKLSFSVAWGYGGVWHVEGGVAYEILIDKQNFLWNVKAACLT